jgi:hypothetical protein
MFFGEMLTTKTLTGGAILIGALICHFLWQIRKRLALSVVSAAT